MLENELAAIAIASHMFNQHPGLVIDHLAHHREIILECGACQDAHDLIVDAQEAEEKAKRN